jgi:hypothetical protein
MFAIQLETLSKQQLTTLKPITAREGAVVFLHDDDGAVLVETHRGVNPWRWSEGHWIAVAPMYR